MLYDESYSLKTIRRVVLVSPFCYMEEDLREAELRESRKCRTHSLTSITFSFSKLSLSLSLSLSNFIL